MKLFTLLIVLLLWQVSFLRQYVSNISFFSNEFNSFFQFFSRFKWLKLDTNPLLFISLISIFASVFDGLLSSNLLSLIYETFILYVMLHSLQKIPFVSSHPALPLEPNLSITDVPDTICQINYIWVAPLTSYLFFGVFGLTFYWALAILNQSSLISSSSKNTLSAVLENLIWIPTRILGFAYCLVGNFKSSMKIFTDFFTADAIYNQFFLKIIARISIKNPSMLNPADFMHLIRDALILLLGFYSLVAILFWII